MLGHGGRDWVTALKEQHWVALLSHMDVSGKEEVARAGGQ